MSKINSEFDTRRSTWYKFVADCRGTRWSTSLALKKIQWMAIANRITPDSDILHVGCGTGELLSKLKAKKAVGIEPSNDLALEVIKKHPEIKIINCSIENFKINDKFDFIILDDVILDCFDIDELFINIRQACHSDTRIVITNYSQLWRPLLNLLRFFRLARPRFGDTWFSPDDLRSALTRCDLELISESQEIILPVTIPFISAFINRFAAKLPFIKAFCLNNIFIARTKGQKTIDLPSVSVVVPARNEAGNISRLMNEIPKMGSWTEVIFVEGNSTDNTFTVIEEEIKAKGDPLFQLIKQPGKGKGDAVRAGFAKASGDILIIYDADLTVPAESLPKFYSIVAQGHADFANGSRLVYGMDKKAMQFLNLLANHFFAHAFTFVIGQPIRDTLCGTKVLWKKLYKKIEKNRSYFGEFDPFGDFDLLFGAAKLHAKILDIPVRYRARVYGKTNISRFKHGILLLKMLIIGAFKLKFC